MMCACPPESVLNAALRPIELGLLSLPLAALTFGTTELGRALHQYNTVAKNVRDGARYLAT